jgi:DNA-binding transcriptional ArsR family regulator
MEKKITKAQMFAQIREVVADNADMVAFIDHELELLAKKSSSKKPTKTQEENAVLKDKIVEALGEFENGATASEVLKSDVAFDGMSNQKISALLKQLTDAGIVNKRMEKKKAIFSVA